MSGISAIYFLDRKGRVIIFRNYRGEVDQDISEGFIDEVLELDEANMKPAFTIDNVHYIWIKHQNIYLVAVGKRNINVALTFSFLYKLRNILVDYFNILEEETVKDNFVLIYELLDEIMDHGLPQTTESKILKDFIMIESNKKTKDNKDNLALTSTMTNIVSWRKEGIKYKENEAWLDVIENVDELISSNGNVLSSQINGKIIMKSFLSGMPTLTLGLNDKVVLKVAFCISKGTGIYIFTLFATLLFLKLVLALAVYSILVSLKFLISTFTDINGFICISNLYDINSNCPSGGINSIILSLSYFFLFTH